MTSPFCIETLTLAHDRTGFASGLEPLGRYFRERARQHVRRRVTACYVTVDVAILWIVGFYTLAAGGIPLAGVVSETGALIGGRAHASKRVVSFRGRWRGTERQWQTGVWMMMPDAMRAAGLALTGLLVTGAAGAAEQVITPAPLSRAAAVNQTVAYAVSYKTANPCADRLTGLGLRIHWDSRQLTFIGLTGVRQAGLVAQGPVEADTADADGDPQTDSFAQVAWADVDGAWPGTGCTAVKLYTANFTTGAGFTSATAIRFSTTSTAAGYALSAKAALAELDSDADGVADVRDSAPLDSTNTGPVIALPLNKVQSAQHGWGWGDQAYHTLLAATFTAAATPAERTDRLLHVQGYDVDAASELALWFNGKRLGYLSRTPNNTLGTAALWWLPAASQVAGSNRLEIRQQTAGETWGVTGLGLYAPGAAFGNLATRSGGDRTHGAGFELHLAKTSAGYLLGVTGYDSDTGDEIQVQLNDTALVDLPKGSDAAWTSRYQLLLPGSWLRSGDNRLVIKNRGAATEDWGLRLDGLRPFGSNLGLLTSIPVPLQFSDRFNLLIAPAATASVLDYRCYDTDTASEVRTVLDGKAAGPCPASGHNTWSADQRVALSANARHVLLLDNTLNPPGTDPWAVKLLAWLIDTDADSVPDTSDNCPSVANLDQANLDGDTDGDLCDTDLDGDGYANAVDAFPRDPTEWRDTDGDGTGDTADLDDDGDGFADAIDPDPLDAGKVPPARIGVWRPGTRAVTLDRDGSLSADTSETIAGPLGASTDRPISGDWNGDGTDELGFYRPSTRVFYLDFDGSGRWVTGEPKSTAFGAAGDLPVTGDWDGDGADEIGTYNPTTRQFTLDLDGSLSPSGNDVTTAAFGAASGLPLSGDWNGDGRDTVGVWRPDTRKFLLDTNGNGQWDGTAGGDTLTSAVGASADLPVCGDWNGDGKDEIGVYRPSELRFYLDSNGSKSLTADDLTSGPFGLAGDLPVAGRW